MLHESVIRVLVLMFLRLVIDSQRSLPCMFPFPLALLQFETLEPQYSQAVSGCLETCGKAAYTALELILSPASGEGHDILKVG